MKTLIFGAGPLGSLYAHLLYQAGKDVIWLGAFLNLMNYYDRMVPKSCSDIAMPREETLVKRDILYSS